MKTFSYRALLRKLLAPVEPIAAVDELAPRVLRRRHLTPSEAARRYGNPVHRIGVVLSEGSAR